MHELLSPCRLCSNVSGIPSKLAWPSLTAEREILAPSFRHEARLRHINFWNALSFDENVVPLSIALFSHQFVIEPRCDGPCARQWKCVCDLCPVVGRNFGSTPCRGEPPFRLRTILRLLKCLLRTMPGDLRGAVFVAGIHHSSRKESPNNS